jgi:site-specific DNA recombinase
MDTQLPLKYCLYARKSSEQDERQAMSIDSQLNEMTALALREGLQIVDVKTESHSAKQSSQRPVFNQVVEDIRNQKYNALLTWDSSRASRNAGDLGSLVDLMDAGLLKEIRTFGQSFGNNPNEKFLLMILCSQAKLENDNRGVNVKRGIRAKCETGWRPCMPPLGYYTRGATGGTRDVIVDEERAPYIIKMFEMSANGKSGRHIRQWLVDNNVRTRGDKQIPLSAVYRILKNTFYYGDFEYPVGSGNWYRGKHTPLITKELFDKVQAQLIVPQKTKWGSKEFPFKQFMTCYSCGSSLVGEEKIKKLKSGEMHRIVYYHCSRQVDFNCKEPYAREEDIIETLSGMCNELIQDVTSLEPGLRKAIETFSRMMAVTHPMQNQQQTTGSYIKYVLQSGTSLERTRLVRNMNVNLSLHQKRLIRS